MDSKLNMTTNLEKREKSGKKNLIKISGISPRNLKNLMKVREKDSRELVHNTLFVVKYILNTYAWNC